MSKNVLWTALLALGCVTSYADTPATPAIAPAASQTAPTTTATPAQQAPQAQVQQPATAVPAAPVTINCDLKLDAKVPVAEQTLMTWSQKATIQSFDFAPETIDDQMSKLKSCFTDEGWVGFNGALKKSGNLEAIRSQHLTVSSQVDGQARVLEAKDNTWKLSMPLQVVYQNDKEKVTQLLNIQLTVGRKATGELGISQLVATPRVNEPQQGGAQAAQPVETTTPDSAAPKDDKPASTPASTPAGQPSQAAPQASH